MLNNLKHTKMKTTINIEFKINKNIVNFKLDINYSLFDLTDDNLGILISGYIDEYKKLHLYTMSSELYYIKDSIMSLLNKELKKLKLIK